MYLISSSYHAGTRQYTIFARVFISNLQMEEKRKRFMQVSCIDCILSKPCKSCAAWQYFLFTPKLNYFIELKQRYMPNFETDMCVLVKQFYIVHEDRAPYILSSLGLKELFDNYSDWEDATQDLYTSSLH